MTTLLRSLPGPRCSSWRCLWVILRGTHSRISHRINRDGARLLAGEGHSLAAYSRALSRVQHTQAADPVEVDLKRLEGGDDGRDTLWSNSVVLIHTIELTHTVSETQFNRPSDTTLLKPVAPVNVKCSLRKSRFIPAYDVI